MATSAAPAPEAPGPINHFGRLFGVLFSPRPTFEDIARRPSWVAPIVLLSLFGLGVVGVMSQRVDWKSFIRQQAERSPRFAQLSEEQKQSTVETQAKVAPMVAYAFGLLGSALVALILAGIYLGVFNVFAGAGLRFGQSFGIVAHALMPSAIASMLAILTMLFKSHGEVDPQRILASNVAALLPSEAPRWQVSLGSSLDVFWIWVLILMGIGYASANPKKISMGMAVGLVMGLWAVWVVVKVGWAAAFS